VIVPFLLMSAEPSVSAAAKCCAKRVALRSKPLRVAVINVRPSAAHFSSTAPLALVALTTSCERAGTAASSFASSSPSMSGPGRFSL
jgi:hypothetical protein